MNTYTAAEIAAIEAREGMADFLQRDPDRRATTLARWVAADARAAAEDAHYYESRAKAPAKSPVRSSSGLRTLSRK